MLRLIDTLDSRLVRIASLALAVALANGAVADLVVRDLDVTVEFDQPVQFDLNDDGVADFEINIFDPNLFGARIIPLNQGAGIIGSQASEVPSVFGPGDQIDGASGETTSGAILSGVDGAPFNEIGATGYVGLALDDDDNISPFFGWAEITRGSLIIGQIGFQTTPGAAAVIPIPEPSAIALAALGLAALSRRRAP